ncbi:cubilin-like isoform X1 [Scylla paramamosain]|uniref:cubilin-like isoform X1 n=1 Tax=Scylla paramamosain TaxID=85552 RepID=UPI0030833747
MPPSGSLMEGQPRILNREEGKLLYSNATINPEKRRNKKRIRRLRNVCGAAGDGHPHPAAGDALRTQEQKEGIENILSLTTKEVTEVLEGLGDTNVTAGLEFERPEVSVEGTEDGLVEGNEVVGASGNSAEDAIMDFINEFIGKPSDPEPSDVAVVKIPNPRNYLNLLVENLTRESHGEEGEGTEHEGEKPTLSYHDLVVANLTRQRVGEEGEGAGDAEDEQVSCGGFVSLNDEIQATITSPGYPNNYPANVECVWTIAAQIGTDSDQVHLWISDFELEDGSCRSDSLRIVDNLVGSSMVLCGDQRQQGITSRGNTLTLTFTSDATVEHKGFLIRVFGLKSTCGEVVQTLGQDPVFLSTPSFPLTPPSESQCHWLVVAKAEMALSLWGNPGQLEDQGVIKISTETFGEYEKYDPDKIYLSDIFTIMFTAAPDSEASQQQGLQFQVVPTNRVDSCNKSLVVTNESIAVIASSKYPRGYQANSRCWWTLHYNAGLEYRSILRMVDFDVEDGNSCRYDHLEIVDERQTAAQRFCGDRSGFQYSTESRKLLLFFQSDAYNLGRHRGFLLVAATERIRNNECTVHKTNNVTYVFASPPPRPLAPDYSVCNHSFTGPVGGRFAVRFSHFFLEKNKKCETGNHLAMEDSGADRKEYFCGDKTGLAFLTAGNLLSFSYHATGTDPTQRFEVEIREVRDPGCGGNHVLYPGQEVVLHTPREGPLEQDCIWVVQGQEDSLLLLDFKNVKTEVQISQTGLFSDLFTYEPRTLHFIGPAERYMILSREAGITITVTAYASFSQCHAVLKLGGRPVIVTNLAVVPCHQVVTSGKESVSSVTSIQYTLLSASHPSTCSLEVTDEEEGAVFDLCSKDWKHQYETSSTRLHLNAIGSSEAESTYVLLVSAVTTSCGDTFDVRERVIVRSRNMERDVTCVYRFVGDGRRMVLDVTTSSRRALSYIRVSTDGSYQTLKDANLYGTISFETTREFLVVVRPFPRSVSFVIHVTKAPLVSSPCDTCIVLREGSQGVITSPHSHGLATYPAHLSCSIKFESEDRNRSVVLEVQHLDLPSNTSLDVLKVVKDDKATLIDPSRVPWLPFTLVLDTPFTLRFRTKTNNEFEGYRIRYDANDCGGIVRLKKDLPITIRSPNSWGQYPTHTRCVWLVEASGSRISDRIKLKIVQFDVHESDFVEVFDPLQSAAPVAVFRGDATGDTLKSVGHQLRVVFTSDGRHVSAGFTLRVRAVASGCGEDIDTSLRAEGVISNRGSNSDSEYCLFRLKPNPGKVVSLKPLKDTGGKKNKPQAGGGEDLQEEEQEVVRVDGECSRGKVVVSTSGALSDGVRYCVGEEMPTLHSTTDVLLLVEAPAALPISFGYQVVGGCGGNLVGPGGILTSPRYPEPFVGPITCVWTSRLSLLVTVTHLDLDPHLDHLILAEPTRAITLAAAHLPRRVLLEGPSTITFKGSSVGVKSGFRLHYDCVVLQRTWHITLGSPAVILGWHNGQPEARAWRVTAAEPGREFVVRVWAAYIPGDPSCEVDYLEVVGTEGGSQRLCGGMMLHTLHLPLHDLTLLLRNSASMAGFVVTVHLVT